MDSTTEETEPAKRRKGAALQTKALAGLVAVMVAAAIIALVFVANSGSTSSNQAGAVAPKASDVGNQSTSASASGAPKTSTAPASKTSTGKSAASTSAGKTAGKSAGKSATKPATKSTHSSQSKTVVYTVKKGDTLTDIGRWYSDHGYLKLYDWNKSVIGENPDLIFPGQKIIVVDGNVGVARHSHN